MGRYRQVAVTRLGAAEKVFVMADKPVQIYDTTLRDGSQGESISFSSTGKVLLARRLDEFGVDYIEGGFPASNPKDMAFFEQMRSQPLSRAQIVAFGSTRHARQKVADDPQIRALLDAGTSVITIYGKSWRLHVSDVLRTALKTNLSMISDSIAYLKDSKRTVFFDAEHFFDGYKDDADYAMKALKAAVDAGADAVVLCDTNGGTMPHEVFTITRSVVETFGVPVGIHTHNDMELAVANTLEAVRAGARQVQGTINGFGERCGNANLCSVIPALELKMGRRCLPKKSLALLREVSCFVNDLVNLRDDPKAPYVGSSAFGHKGGAHVNAVKKNPKTFEHIDPAWVGNDRRVLVSELAGGDNVLVKAVELGLGRQASREGAREILGKLKQLESQGYAFEAADASFHILIQKVLKRHRSFFELEGFRVAVEKTGGSPCVSEATVKVRVKDEIEHTVAEGDGPVDALNRALRKALTRFYPAIAKVLLTDYRVRILDPEEATAAKTRVLIESSDGVDSWGTVGVSGNLIEASWEALVDSVEYVLFKEEKEKRRRARQMKREKSR